MRHAFGATLAIRRSGLEAIGGFRAVGAYLAYDYMLEDGQYLYFPIVN